MWPDVGEPCTQIVKGILPREVKAQEDDMRAFVKDASDWAERLLSRRVPDLHLYHFLVQFYHEGSEFDAYCDLMLNFELFIHHTR